MCEEKSGCMLSTNQLEYAIKRNFGGIDPQVLDTYNIFLKHLEKEPSLKDTDESVRNSAAAQPLIKNNDCLIC